MYQKRISSVIRGYHVYDKIWTATVGEVLECVREPSNVIDRYAVAVTKNQIVVGHLPKKISRVCSLFLRRGGTIQCEVTGNRQRSRDLIQGGLEIPCVLIFSSEKKAELKKAKKLLLQLLDL